MLGSYSLITRQNMLDALAQMVKDDVPWRDMHASHVARDVGRSPSAFYDYWPTIEDAFLVMMNEFALNDVVLTRRFYRIRAFIMEERGMVVPDCVHVYEYWWDADDRVSRGTCLKCGHEKVVEVD